MGNRVLGWWLKIDCKDFQIKFHVKGYHPNDKRTDGIWCVVDLIMDSKDNIVHYSLLDDEALEYSDLKILENDLSKALSGKLQEETLIEPMEPYMQFLISPKTENGYGPGMDLRVYPWADSDCSDSFLNFYLEKDSMKAFLVYLQLLHGEVSVVSSNVKKLVKKGVLFQQ